MTEKIIIKKLLEDKNYFTTVFGDIKITDFERPEHQAIFKSLGMLYNQYKKQPSVDEINLFVDASTEIKIPLKALMREELNEIRNTPVNISDEILVDMTEKYIKNTRFKAVLMRGVEVLDGSSKKDSIESLSEETNDIRKMTFKKSLGLDYIRDYKSNFVQYGEVEEAGIKAPLDIINVSTGGGFKPGTLTVIASVSNGGKTIFLSNISGFTALQGKNVALFHMEETELEVRERIDAYLLNKETSELKVQGTSLIGPFEHLISKGFGNIKIRSYGPNTASCLHFQAQLDDWKLQDGFIPDIIIADSITIIKPNSNVDGLYGKGKAVSEELKSLGVYNNVPIVSAVQLGRGSYGVTKVGMEDVAEAIAISQIASTMIGVVLDEHRPDIRICSVLKSRKVNKAKIKPVIVNANTERQTLSDLTDSDKRVYLKQEQKEVLQEMNNIVEKAEEIEKCPEKGKSILDSILNI